MITHGKDYYVAPAYVILLSAGALATERLFAGRVFARRRLRVVLQTASFVWLMLGVAPLLPVVLPVLPIDAS